MSSHSSDHTPTHTLICLSVVNIAKTFVSDLSVVLEEDDLLERTAYMGLLWSGIPLSLVFQLQTNPICLIRKQHGQEKNHIVLTPWVILKTTRLNS